MIMMLKLENLYKFYTMGTHHVLKCTRPSADENTLTPNYNLRSMRAWRREKAWFRGYAGTFYHVMRAATVIKRHRVVL